MSFIVDYTGFGNNDLWTKFLDEQSISINYFDKIYMNEFK